MHQLISFDFAIKYLLRDKGNYDIVEGFISALLESFGYPRVKILALLETESNKEALGQKKSIADLVVEDVNHNKYIIEIERQEGKEFIHKACFNTSRLIVDNLSSGEDFGKIKKIFHITLLYFEVGEGPIHHGKTEIKELESGKPLTVHLRNAQTQQEYNAVDILPEYIFISIPLFKDKIKKEIDEWLYVMKHEEVKPDFKSKYMKKVVQKLDILKMTTEMRNEYYKYLKELNSFKGAIEAAIEKGEVKGMEKGMKKGVEKGRDERNIEIAETMLKEGLKIDVIARYTGLSITEIKSIKKQAD